MSDDPQQRSALHYAAMTDDQAEVDRLLLAGEDPNVVDRVGFTPLHFAAQEFALASAKRLLADPECNVDQANTYGNSPLSLAVFYSRGRGEMIDLLRRAGADPLRTNAYGQSPVGLARLIGNYDIAKHFADIT